MASRSPGLTAADVGFGSQRIGPQIREHIFRERGDNRYSLELLPAGITFDVDRLRRQSHELHGELSVTVNGSFSHAKTVDGALTTADMNLSSMAMRVSRAKILAERSAESGLDWFGFLEEFCVKVITAERQGKSSQPLHEVPEAPDTAAQAWHVLGWPVLKDLPMVLFGDSEAGKSFFALYVAGVIAAEYGPVLYADWEFTPGEHRKRFARLFQPMPTALHYAHCEKPLADEVDRLARLIQTTKSVFLVCDSIGFAVRGPAESQEGASEYFRALRALKIGSLNIAHIPKQYDDSREAQIFGSAFFRHGARSVWYIERAKETAANEICMGLYHRKNNIGPRLAPHGYRLTFQSHRIAIDAIDPKANEELVSGLPLLDRVKHHLKAGAKTVKELAEVCGTTTGALRSIFSRHQSQFVKVGNRYGLQSDLEF